MSDWLPVIIIAGIALVLASTTTIVYFTKNTPTQDQNGGKKTRHRRNRKGKNTRRK